MATEATASSAERNTDPYSIPPHVTKADTSSKTSFAVGTRLSALALAQTDIVLDRLRPSFPSYDFPIHKRQTAGDKNQITALHAFNAKSLWTTELEDELTAKNTDFIVHSLKDMPTQLPAGCTLGAVLARTERRDCVVMSPTSAAQGYRTLADLPAGSVVGTSSVRRIAQIRKNYPALKMEDVRGNINTRLRKLDAEMGPFQALILAGTGPQRLGWGDRISSFLSRKEGGWLGAVGQGGIGVETRLRDEQMEPLLELMMADQKGEPRGHGWKTLWECLAERSLLRALEGGCSVPVGVETEWEENDLVIYALVASVDGKECVEDCVRKTVSSREQAEQAGLEMAGLLIEKGAGKILEAITLNRNIVEESGGA